MEAIVLIYTCNTPSLFYVDSSFFHLLVLTWQHPSLRSIIVHCACECPGRYQHSYFSKSMALSRATLGAGQTRLWVTRAQIMRVTHNIQYSCTKWIYEDRHCYSLFIALQIFMIPTFVTSWVNPQFSWGLLLKSLSSCKILKCYHKLKASHCGLSIIVIQKLFISSFWKVSQNSTYILARFSVTCFSRRHCRSLCVKQIIK